MTQTHAVSRNLLLRQIITPISPQQQQGGKKHLRPVDVSRPHLCTDRHIFILPSTPNAYASAFSYEVGKVAENRS